MPPPAAAKKPSLRRAAKLAAKPPAKPRPTSFERTAPKFESAALATPEGRKKAVLALRAVRRGVVDDARWLDRCLGLLTALPPEGGAVEIRELRADVLSTVIHLQDPRAANQLLSLLDDGAVDSPRAMIVFVIGKLGDRAAVPPLLSWFNRQNGRNSERVYREIADTLIRLADARVFKLVERALKREATNDYQRWAYEQALESIMKGRAPSHSLWLR